MTVSELISLLSDKSQEATVVINVGGTQVSDISVEAGESEDQVVLSDSQTG